MPRPYKVGLTGGIGSGKSVAASIFSGLGIPVLDADQISKELTSTSGPVTSEIIQALGTGVTDNTGKLDRSTLRQLIFTDISARIKLEAILHPLIYNQMLSKYVGLSAPYCIFCIPLLFETGAHTNLDRVLVIDCPVELQVERACHRDNVSPALIEKIINSQISREQRLESADDVLVNDGSIETLNSKIHTLHLQYLKLVNKPLVM